MKPHQTTVHTKSHNVCTHDYFSVTKIKNLLEHVDIASYYHKLFKRCYEHTNVYDLHFCIFFKFNPLFNRN